MMDKLKWCLFLPFVSAQQQLTCQVLQPTGWESGADGSGLRPSSTGYRAVGENITYSCPGIKVGGRDSKSIYKAACLEEFKGYAAFKYEFDFPWPTCSCPETTRCKVDDDSKQSISSTKYAYNIEVGDDPGVDLKIPMPTSTKVWEILVTWDTLTLNENIAITTRSKGVKLERTDFQGQQYRLSPLNLTSSIVGSDGVLHIDIGFNFRDEAIRSDSQKWHYPCIERLECKAIAKKAEITLANMMIVFAIVAGVVILCSCVCGSITWCLKNDKGYGVRPGTAWSVRTVKVRPFSAESAVSRF